jgi:hypothetical protein
MHAKTSDPLIENPESAEQQNSDLAFVKANVSHMRQTTLLYFVRRYLYKLATQKADSTLRRDHTKHARWEGRPVKARALPPDAAAAALASKWAAVNAV